MANKHTTLTSLFDDIADAIRENTPVTEQIKADAFPAYIRMLGYDGTIPATPSVLNSCPWDFIRWASDQGIADLLWSVGDRKGVSINNWGSTNTDYQINSGTYYCYILGFNHNSEFEGDNRIHFEFGFDAISGGNHISFCGGDYSMAWGSGNSSPFFTRMNTGNSNVGGWGSSLMRTGTLNGENRSFKTAIPSDLKSIVKVVTKYTDNYGGGNGNTKANVTATSDIFFLPNFIEIYGDPSYINSFESDFTKQYQYYKNGNSPYCKKMDNNTVETVVFSRSPRRDNSTQFRGRGAYGTGVYSSLNAGTSYGVSPCFCV